MDRARREDGFSLVELMILVVIIAVLLAVAIPTFLGTRNRASDRAVQTEIRNAQVAEAVYFTDEQKYTDNDIDLRRIDGSLRTTTYSGSGPIASYDVIYVHVAKTVLLKDTVYLAGRSRSGRCFWMRTVATQSFPRFAENDCSDDPDPNDYLPEW